MNWCEHDNIEIAYKCPGCERCDEPDPDYSTWNQEEPEEAL